MKLIKEIKRRVRNVAKAAAGKEFFSPPVEVRLSRAQVELETFAAERFISLAVDELTEPEKLMEYYRRDLAKEIGSRLLYAGALKEEIIQGPNEWGLRGRTLRLSVRAVIPEEGQK